MSRKFSFTVQYSVPVEELHRALTNDEMWNARFADATTATLELSHPDGPGTIRIHMTEKAPEDKIPGLVKKVLKSDLMLERTDTWGALEGDTAKGAFQGASGGITTEMEGTFELRPTAEGSEIEAAGTVAVKVPLVGGAIEPLVENLLEKVMNSERKSVEAWFASV
ncbi:DUF2505 domain-containing protein [Nocardia sp. NBC_01503]|uniref:DUF2505 domain-containing protein n=1 Tax=Nocardia sp. NBC_01503 TaxID=2975997 RepID=UPI002E7ACC01|nr:DUF2505 domain-containing protein [Nocardia sp. NBC_01503]WTL35309.1 DUF2505 domain-containing protein [Nocardia sp. NBC_01503]